MSISDKAGSDTSKESWPVYFIGAGPGDPELLTLKAKRLLTKADVIIYTGSLVPKKVLTGCKGKCFNSAGMHLDQVIEIMVQSYRAGEKVVRLHTGDPAIYSAISEQISRLKMLSIPYEVIPGVTSGFAACARLGAELTIPEKVQTVIISRIAGRTPVPEKEALGRLSKIQASLILYLSAGYIDKVVDALLKGYEPTTPVAVVEKATWPEERIITGTLNNISQKVKQAGIKKTAVIIVGQALKGIDDPSSTRSYLYHEDFSHEFRKGQWQQDKKILHAFADTVKRPSATGTVTPTLLVFLGEKGKKVAKRLYQDLDTSLELLSFKELKERQILEKRWNHISSIIFISACQIAVRTIAPYIRDKYLDPAVVAVDESCRNCVCLLSGHLGGGNELAKKVAGILGATPVITTQSDVLKLVPLDLWAKANGLVPADAKGLKDAQAAMRNGKKLNVFLQEDVYAKKLPPGLVQTRKEEDAQISIGPFIPQNHKCLHLVTRNLNLGTGCHKGLSPDHLLEKALSFIGSAHIHPFSIKNVCTIDKKEKEPAIVKLAEYLEATLRVFSSEDLNRIDGIEGSDVVQNAVGAKAVSEPASLLCAKGGKLLMGKKKFQACTFAISSNPIELCSDLEGSAEK